MLGNWKLFGIVLFATYFISASYGEISITPSHINMGKLDKRKGQIRQQIVFENRGTNDHHINFVSSSCGCAEVEDFNGIIKADSSISTWLKIDPMKSGKGMRTQQVIFSTSDPKTPYLMLTISWFIRMDDVEISPQSVNLELAQNEVGTGKAKNSIFILDAWEKRLEITDINSSPHLNFCFYDILYRCERGNLIHTCRIDTTLLDSNLPVGESKEWVSFKTNHPKYATVVVPFNIHIESAVAVIPQILIFSKSDTSKKIELSSKNNPLEISSVKISDNSIKLEQHMVNKNKCILDVTLSDRNRNNTDTLSTAIITVAITKPQFEERQIEICY